MFIVYNYPMISFCQVPPLKTNLLIWNFPCLSLLAYYYYTRTMSVYFEILRQVKIRDMSIFTLLIDLTRSP